MSKKRLPLLLLAGFAAVFFILYFALVIPIRNADATTTKKPPVSTLPGEGSYLTRRVLFPQIPRDKMLSITIHNESGDYRFGRTKKTEDAVLETSDFSMYQKEDGEYVSYSHIAYDQTLFSELVVGTGTVYVYDRILDAGTDQETLAKYGLAEADDPDSYEILWFETGTDGEKITHTERVFVGDAAVTDDGYYIRREGQGGVYVSVSTRIGRMVKAPLSSFVDPALSTQYAQYGYFYTRAFSLFQALPDGETVKDGDRVTLSYRTYIDGQLSALLSDTVDLSLCQEQIRAALVGKTGGGGDFSFSVAYGEDGGAYAGKTVEYRVERIERIERLFLSADFLNRSERDDFHYGSAYTITAPDTMRGYLVNTTNLMDVLEAVGTLAGSETVAVGLRSETMERYGLYAYRLYYETPSTASSDKIFTEDTNVLAYVPNCLYISEKQADGSYYVGSALHDIVAKVDGASLSFLSEPFSFWLATEMFSVVISSLEDITFTFTYPDVREVHTFRVESSVNADGRATAERAYYVYTESGQTIEREIPLGHYQKLHLNLLTVYYAGMYDGTVPTEELTAKAGACTLTVDLSMTDGSRYQYRFYPYSERHVLVAASERGYDAGAYFYITADETEKIYRDIGKIILGEEPDADRRY